MLQRKDLKDSTKYLCHQYQHFNAFYTRLHCEKFVDLRVPLSLLPREFRIFLALIEIIFITDTGTLWMKMAHTQDIVLNVKYARSQYLS